MAPCVLLFSGVASMAMTTAVSPGASHVPPFYTPNTGETVPGAVFAIFGAIFGGIHVIGWNFTYPTLVERTLWRVSAVLITVIPAYLFFVEHLGQYALGYKPGTPEAQGFQFRGVVPKFILFLFWIGSFLLIVYIFARISLLGQSFALLRSQPASAFRPVNWVTFFPHLS
jgi:hypothetical protein